jgi:hypothetical protein
VVEGIDESRIGDDTMKELTRMKRNALKNRKKISKKILSPAGSNYSSFSPQLPSKVLKDLTESIPALTNEIGEIEKSANFQSPEEYRNGDVTLTDYTYSAAQELTSRSSMGDNSLNFGRFNSGNGAVCGGGGGIGGGEVDRKKYESEFGPVVEEREELEDYSDMKA